MKQVYLILAALMLLCLAPMPYGYYMLVRFVAMVAFGVMAYRVGLLPQRFVPPPARTPHGGRIDGGVFGEQCLDVLGESIRRIDGVKPVGDIAQVGVELIRLDVPVRNPRQRCSSWQNRHNRETAVPDTGMVGAFVAQNGDAGQPTAQNEVLRQTEIPRYKVFCRVVGKVRVEFRQSAECENLKRFPSRRKLWCVVFRKVLCDEIFLRPLDFPTDMCNIGLETSCVLTEIIVSKPEWAMFCGEIANHLAARGYFYLQNSMKDELLQLCVEVIDINYITEMGVGFKGMGLPVYLHRTPIICQTEITRPVEDGYGFSLIVNNKPPLFQGFNLLSEGKGLLGIFHNKKKKSRPVALPERGRVPGSIGCKGTTFNRNFQMIWQKSA